MKFQISQEAATRTTVIALAISLPLLFIFGALQGRTGTQQRHSQPLVAEATR